eukprot:XP_011666588.1 PREDICTED: phosphatidylinositol transfer protein alpha isoform isoform X1 [Strongylocentrotus purpuratus]
MAAPGPLYLEYRIVLPYVSLDEIQIGLLYTLCKTSLAETGGGEGVEIVTNEPGTSDTGEECQYYHKILHLASKVPSFIRLLAPKGALEVHSKAWNYHPKIHTEYSNPDYMKDAFLVDVQTIFKDNDKATEENVFDLDDEKKAKRETIELDIVNDRVSPSDYSEDTDPTKVRLEKISRGPLTADWKDTETKFLTVYMFVEIKFKWWGLQTKVQSVIHRALTRFYGNFYRTLICSLDEWYGMTMENIRELEEKTKRDLNEARCSGEVRGMMVK